MAKLTINNLPQKKELIGGRSRAELLEEIDQLRKTRLKKSRPEEIKTASPFKELFPVKEEVLLALQVSMKQIGFDENHPIIIWKEKGVLIDGHCRVQAALNLDLAEILFIEKSFISDREALQYAFSLQFHRRNLDEADRFVFVEGLFHNNVIISTFFSEGINRNNLAPLLSVAVSTAQKYITIIKKGEEEDKEKIRQREATVNRIYKKICLQKANEDEVTPISVRKVNEPFPKKEKASVVTLSLTSLKEVFKTWKIQKGSDITRTIREGVIKDLFSSHPEIWELYRKT